MRHFGGDVTRERFIFVDELTHDEAANFLTKRGSKLEKEDMESVFENVGTYPTC